VSVLKQINPCFCKVQISTTWYSKFLETGLFFSSTSRQCVHLLPVHNFVLNRLGLRAAVTRN
jgi:hypothetical protein